MNTSKNFYINETRGDVSLCHNMTQCQRIQSRVFLGKSFSKDLLRNFVLETRGRCNCGPGPNITYESSTNFFLIPSLNVSPVLDFI